MSKYHYRYRKPQRRHFPVRLALVLLALLALCIYPFIEARTLTVDEHTVQVANLPANLKNLKIVYATDIHQGRWFSQSRVNELVKTINGSVPIWSFWAATMQRTATGPSNFSRTCLPFPPGSAYTRCWATTTAPSRKAIFPCSSAPSRAGASSAGEQRGGGQAGADVLLHCGRGRLLQRLPGRGGRGLAGQSQRFCDLRRAHPRPAARYAQGQEQRRRQPLVRSGAVRSHPRRTDQLFRQIALLQSQDGRRPPVHGAAGWKKTAPPCSSATAWAPPARRCGCSPRRRST